MEADKPKHEQIYNGHQFAVEAEYDRYYHERGKHGRFIIRLVKFFEPYYVNPPYGKGHTHAFLIYDNTEEAFLANEIGFEDYTPIKERARELNNQHAELKAFTQEVISYVEGKK